MTYQPLRFFLVPGVTLAVLGGLFGLRFLYFYATEGGQGHIQSLVLTAILILVGVLLVLFGLLAELIGVNRKVLEDIQWRTRCMELDANRTAVDDRE